MSGGFRKLITGPFGWMLLLLVVLEVVATFLNPYRDAPTAAEYPRNAYFRRGWPEYLANNNPVDVILLGNSQSHGREISADRIFPKLLDDRFSAGSPPMKLESWAVYGRTPADLELLLMEAARRKPRLIVYLATLGDYAMGPREYELGFSQHDTNLLIADPRLWPSLMGTRLLYHMTTDAFLHHLAAGSLDVVRLRAFALDNLASRMHPMEYRILMGHVRDEDNLIYDWSADNTPQLAVEGGFRLRNPPSRETMNRRLYSLPLLLEDMERLTTDEKIPLLWVWQPVADGLLTPEQLREARRFYLLATQVLRNHGFRVVDLRDLIPKERFYTVSHFDPEGHELMATALEPFILDAL